MGLDDEGNTSKEEPAWLVRWLGFSLFGQGAVHLSGYITLLGET